MVYLLFGLAEIARKNDNQIARHQTPVPTELPWKVACRLLFGLSSFHFVNRLAYWSTVVRVEISNDMIERAQAAADQLGCLNNSIRQGAGNLAGFLGEECFLAAYPDSVRAGAYTHDILHRGLRIEIKTKDRTVIPQPHFEVSVSQYNTRQNPDAYVFVSLLREQGRYVSGYLLGFHRPDDYFKRARLLSSGDVDFSNAFIVSASCYNLAISELRPMKRQSN